MQRLLLVLILLGSLHTLAAQSTPPKEETPFQPAAAQSVTDILIPYTSIGSGTVVLDAVISEEGKVQKVEVRRGIVSLTEPAVSAVKEWEFTPATFAGNAIPSRVPVAVNVRPRLYYVDQVPLPALVPQTDAAIQAEFQPAEVTRAVFPNSAGGDVTVVLEVNLSETGKVEKVSVVRDVPTATPEAEAAVGEWRFIPATYNGKPVQSKIILAFVFLVPAESIP